MALPGLGADILTWAGQRRAGWMTPRYRVRKLVALMVDESFSAEDSVMAMLPNLSELTLIGAETIVPIQDAQGNQMMEDLYVQTLPGMPRTDIAVDICMIGLWPSDSDNADDCLMQHPKLEALLAER